MAAVYGIQEEYTQAKSYIREAILINEKMGNRLWVGINTINLGLTFQKIQKPDSAFLLFENALDEFTALNNVMQQSKCRLNMGAFFLEKGDFVQSAKYAGEALNQAQTHEMKKVILDS